MKEQLMCNDELSMTLVKTHKSKEKDEDERKEKDPE